MARRQLDTSFWDDGDVATLAPMERLLLICMITDTSLSDDYGRLPAHPAILKKHAFGYDDYTVEQVRDWSQNIIRTCANVRFYAVNRQGYIELRNFEQYQSARYKRRSNIPVPPDRDSQNISQSSQTISEDSRTSRDELSREEMSSDEESRGEVGRVGPVPAAAAPLPPESRPEPNADPVVAHLFTLLDKAAVFVGSPAQGEQWKALLEITRDPDLLTETFDEAAKGSIRPSPRWCRAVLERCIRDGVRPGKWNGRARASPSNSHAEDDFDWQAYSDQLAQAREDNDGPRDDTDDQGEPPP